LEFLAEIDESPIYATETQCLTNNECQNYLAFFVNITGHLNDVNFKHISLQKQQTVQKFVQQCCFLQSKARTSKFANQADNISHFMLLFSERKDQLINS